jgi:NAD(P)-dependent dehydrogenase (short-subunit alcohol dehydrogenase family)
VQLEGRVALVTGGGQRLGRAFAAALAERGMSLALHYNASMGGAEALRDAIRAAGGTAEFVAADRTHADAPRKLPAPVARAMGGRDGLVN